MYKAAMLFIPYPSSPPTAKEVQSYLKRSGTLLYGGNKRRTALTPIQAQIDTVYHAFRAFETAITGSQKGNLDSHDLYVFDEQVNDVHFLLKYGGQMGCYFRLDDHIINSMGHYSWSHWRLKQLKKSIQDNARYDHLIKDEIGDRKFHRSFPKFARASTDFVLKVDEAIKVVERDATSLFKSGW